MDGLTLSRTSTKRGSNSLDAVNPNAGIIAFLCRLWTSPGRWMSSGVETVGGCRTIRPEQASVSDEGNGLLKDRRLHVEVTCGL